MRRCVIFLLVVVVVVAGRAAALTNHSVGDSRGTVVFLGDSNEVVSASWIAGDLLDRDHGYIDVNIATAGSTIRYGDCQAHTNCPTYDYWKARVADTVKSVHPDVFVIDLGINDTVSPGDGTGVGYKNYGAKIDWLLSLLGSTPVLWTNLPCKIEPLNRRTGCVTVNAALKAARHANLRVLDWARVANSHPGFIGGYGEIHLTNSGQAAWAKLVGDALDAQFPN
jgi:hypothetical protein